MPFGHYGNDQYRAGPGDEDTAASSLAVEPDTGDSNLLVWLRAGENYTLQDTDRIVLWGDKSSNNNDVAQTNYPAFDWAPVAVASDSAYNNQPVLDCTGGGGGSPEFRFMPASVGASTNDWINATAWTIIGVFSGFTGGPLGGGNESGNIISCGTSATTGPAIEIIHTGAVATDTVRLVAEATTTGAVSITQSPAVDIDTDVPHIYVGTWDGTDMKFWIDNTLIGTTGLVGTNVGADTNGMHLCAYDQAGNGTTKLYKMAEMIGYDDELSTSEREGIQNYLAARYDITLA